ncbi:MAG: toxin TcdB middle/N-terminal domain-containing protein [Kofleriaceae bacterium]
MALVGVMTSPLFAMPGDITQVSAPSIGNDPPKAQALNDGDTSVSTQTGAFSYSYQIRVPPGRRGMAPQLALTYSSSAPVYGGVAAGWALDVPEIHLDTSSSVLAQTYWIAPLAMADAWKLERYVSSMAGGRPLVEVQEGTPAADVLATYRAQADGSFARYERLKAGEPYRWRVLTTDGVTHYFGGANFKWTPLLKSVDSFGNTIEYVWTRADLTEVRYTSNPTASPSLPAFATIRFLRDYTRHCGNSNIGAQTDHRLGIIRGEGRLDKIQVFAHTPGTYGVDATVQHTREITLSYDGASEACSDIHGPIRQLTAIQESAWGDTEPRVDLPPVTFEYNRLTRTLDETFTLASGPFVANELAPANLGWGQRLDKTTVDGMMLDFDGDGLQDRLATYPDAGECKFTWQRNLGRQPSGVLFSAPSAPIKLPRLPWANFNATHGATEYCSLSGQKTDIENKTPGYNCDGPHGSQLAYRWLDMNGDGLPDLVTAVHQESQYFDVELLATPPFGQWPACDIEQPGKCPVIDQHCMASALSCPVEQECSFDAGAVQSCMLAAPRVGCDEMMAKGTGHDWSCYSDCMAASNPPPGDWQHFDLGCQSKCALNTHVDPMNDPGRPPSCHSLEPQLHTQCGGYPWMVYTNQGGGTLASQAQIIYQPVPLESDSGDSSFGGRGVSSAKHAIQDFDGDGDLDAVVAGRGPVYLPGFSQPDILWWFVFLGDGTGKFRPFAGNDLPYLWAIPSRSLINTSCTTHPGVHCNPLNFSPTQTDDFDVRTLSTIADVTGDGAADLVWKFGAAQATHVAPPEMATVEDDDPLRVFPGDGGKFKWVKIGGAAEYPAIVPLNQGRPALAYINRSYYDSTANDPILTHISRTGIRESRARLLDFDSDGRLDIIGQRFFDNEWFWPALYMNAGDAAMQTTPTLSAALASALHQRTDAFETGYLQAPFAWATKEDFTDIDGDGLPEAWKFGASSVTITRDADLQPLRLMKKVRNGRGGTTTISYANTTNTAVVTLDPTTRKAVPSPEWVVDSLVTTDQWDTDVSTTTYRYKHPVWSPDDAGRYGFRGFEEVTTIAPSGARTVESYDFAIDWSGRLKTSRTYSLESNPGSTLTTPTTIAETVWGYGLLFGKIYIYRPLEDRAWTCRNGQSESACRATPAALLKHRHSWYAVADAGGVPRIYEERFTYTQDSEAVDAGDRYTVNFLKVHAGPTFYRVQPTTSGVREYTDPSTTRWQSYESYGYDGDWKQRVATSRYFNQDAAGNPDATTSAVSMFGYDSATGVQLWERAPNQYPSGPSKQIDYDVTRRFAVSVTDEKSHIVTSEYEPGTGAQIWQEGPHRVSCGTSCTNATKTWTDVDGLGRPLASWVNREVPGLLAWQKTKVATTSYVDAVVGGARPSITAKSLIDYDQTRWTEETTQLDSRGRPVVVTAKTGASTPNAVTSYDYDARGQMVSATLPDASAAPGQVQYVTYTYTYDSLGRPTSMLRPSIGGQARAGVTRSYDGVLTQTDEIAGGQGGAVARKVTVADHLGRLVEVREFTNLAAGSSDSTFYQYDARDAVTRIQNADQVITEINHDWGGRRTSIVRAGRTWSFTYDKNGNLVSERLPSPNVASEPNYTNTFVYDELDRVSSRSVGTRGFDAANAALLGLGQVVYSYDTCTGGTGRLCSTHDAAASVIAGVPTPALTLSWTYDAEGNQTSETMAYNVGGLTGTRTSAAAYGPGGKVTVDTFADNSVSSPTTKTKAKYAYDDRGLPSSLAWVPAPGGADRVVALQTRNVAGLVTSRNANLSGVASLWRNFTTTFTYDAVGRVLKQEVKDAVSTTPHASQALTYGGTDDPLTMIHKLGATTYNFTYGYSARHELTSVGEGSGRYNATYAYHPGGKLLSAQVGGVGQPGGATVPRNVNYEYGAAVDPEAPSGLKTVGSNSYIRSYAYDTVGNLSALTEGTAGVTGQFQYDGDDQLRRAIKLASGTEVGREEYYYDAAGTRRAVVTRNASGTVTAGRLFMGGTEIELTGTGAVGKAFAYLSLGTPVGKVISTGGWAVGQNSTSVGRLELQYHGLADSTLLAVWPNGEVQGGFIYAPYGEVVQSAGLTTSSIASQRRRFNDKFEDDLTGLGYYGVRYYDKVMIGWTQADPMYRFVPDAAWAEPRKAGLYGFVLGNPMRYVDPDGRNPVVLLLPPAAEAIEGSSLAAPVVAGLQVATVAAATATAATIAPHLPSALTGSVGAYMAANGLTYDPEANTITESTQASAAMAATAATQTGPDNGKASSHVGKAGATTTSGSAAAAATSAAAQAAQQPVAEHRKNKRRSNKEKHQNGDSRRKRDQNKKPGMRPKRIRPPGHKGPWPP